VDGAEVVEGKVAEEVGVEVEAERAEAGEVEGVEAGEAGAQLREKGEVDS